MSRRLNLLILLGILILAAGLRLYGLDRQSLWYDEVYEEMAFQRQFLGDKTGVVPDTPPLHSTLIYIITRQFPGNDFALRMAPFTFGIMSIPLMYLLGKKLFTEKVGLIASFLLAISPFHIWYSQEARMYALQWMLTLISMIYFMRSLEQPRKNNFIGYVISTVACFYTIQLTLFLVIVQFLYVLFLRKYRSQLIKWIAAFSSVIILYSPWIIYNLTSLMGRGTSFTKQVNPVIVILYTFYAYAAGFSIGPSLREYHFNLSLSVINPYIAVIGAQMLLYGSLIIMGIWSIRKDLSRLLLIILLTIVPIIGFIILINTVMTQMTYNVRYTGIALFGFILLVTLGVEWLSHLKQKMLGRMFSILAIVAITGFSTYSYINYHSDIRYAKPNMRGAVAYVEENREEGDMALCIVDGVTFNRYANKNFHCETFSNTDPSDQEEIESELRKIVKGKKRLWLVLGSEWFQIEWVGFTKAWLDSNYKEIKPLHKGLSEIANLRIYCYDLTKEKTSQITQ